MRKNRLRILLFFMLVLGIVSCENVEDGYRIDYPESTADFTVSLISSDRGAISDTISYLLEATSDYDINSLVVKSNISGANGTGYVIYPDMEDPLIDHVFGTIQSGTRNINMVYNYIVSQDTLDADLTFTLIDDFGKKTVGQTIITVPSITKYYQTIMYSQSVEKADGFSSVDGLVYHDLQNYEELNVENEAIQQSLDLIFVISGGETDLVAPYSGRFSSSMAIRNKTLVKLMPGVSNEEFDKLSSASLSLLTEEHEIKKGSTSVQNVKVGDILGFRTDFASLNPYHFGMLRINAIHPTNIEYYEGVSYLIEADIVTQK